VVAPGKGAGSTGAAGGELLKTLKLELLPDPLPKAEEDPLLPLLPDDSCASAISVQPRAAAKMAIQ